MLEEKAVVTRTEKDQVRIKGLQSGGCGGCSQQSGCATAALASAMPQRELKIDCDLTLATGDEVYVSIDDSFLLRASFQLYLLPLLTMLLSLVIAERFLAPYGFDLCLLPIALFSLMAGFYVVKRFPMQMDGGEHKLRIQK